MIIPQIYSDIHATLLFLLLKDYLIAHPPQRRRANHEKFTEECEIYMEKHVLFKNMFTNRLNMGLLL